jgi:hypothetical protein
MRRVDNVWYVSYSFLCPCGFSLLEVHGLEQYVCVCVCVYYNILMYIQTRER